ncbi:probable disease resistance protein At5g45440 [Miscanthus floridulus]|uniref:probable disease resistance protein At5g45440 n=1 Tax=Miscanthus floridulus TaxID=154761 RepID=UPI003458F514
MAVEVVQFLVKKFVDSFTEEAADGEAELPFRAQFHDMRAQLEKAAVSPSNADELRECLYELNDLLAECRRLANRPNHQRWCFAQSDAWRFPKTKKRVTAVRRRVLQCVENDSGGNAAASQEDSAAAAAGLDRWTTSWLERSRIHGFDQQLAELESMAFRDCGAGRLNGVGIVGMGGIGKTALAQLLFSSPRAKGRFFPRIWMCMSRTASAGADRRKEVLQGMLMALGHEEDAILSIDGSDSLAELVIAVHEQLKGKRFLVVFDDVWHIDSWYADVVGRQNAPGRTDDWSERLAFALPKERGGLVVVTSRLEKAAEAMVGKSCLSHVRPLADSESCWAIFTDALSQSQEKMTLDLATVNNLKQEILETCGGLPSAAKTMGDIFATSSVSPPASTSTSQELGKSDHIITGHC